MKNHATGISEILDQLETPLEKLVSEGKSAMNKVASREKYLNTQFAAQLQDLTKTQVTFQNRKTLIFEKSGPAISNVFKISGKSERSARNL